MQANKFGFNTSARACKDEYCNTFSQCEYKARDYDLLNAYGPNGSLINTNNGFKVKTEFLSNEAQTTLTGLRTTLTQNGSELVLEANCEGEIEGLNDVLDGKMAVIISNWDNRDYQVADFEDKF